MEKNNLDDNIRNLNVIIDKLLDSNKNLSLKLYENILNCASFNSEVSHSSEWLLSKQNLKYFNQISQQYLLAEREKLMFKNIGSNMIIEGIVTKVDLDQSKKVYIEVRLSRILAVCFDGESLIDDSQPYYINNIHKCGLNSEFLMKNYENYKNIYKYNIVGFIRKHDIYDNKLAYLNDEIDSLLKIDSIVNCLIVRNKLQESKYKNDSLKNNEFIQLSLKNSLIKGAKQHFLADYLIHLQIPLILGINHMTNTGKWINSQLMVKDNTYNNESLLATLEKDLKISEYGSLFPERRLKTNEESGFCYEKMRKVQNYDWSDDCLKKGIDLINSNFYEKAIEYLKDAEKLDPLNKDIYIQKGLAYCGMVYINKIKNNLSKAYKEFKKCLKIEPKDETAMKFLLTIKSKKESESEKKSSKMTYTFDFKEEIINQTNLLQKKRVTSEK